MNKTQFIRSLAEANGISYKQAGEEVGRFLEHTEIVVSGLGHEETLNLTGTVKFTVKEIEARTARNPQNGEAVQVPAGKSVRASIGKSLKTAVKATV